MTNEEKAKEIAEKIVEQSNEVHYMYIDATVYLVEDAAIEMAQWKDEQLKKVCKKCEQHIIDSGKDGCAYRSLGNEYCWED